MKLSIKEKILISVIGAMLVFAIGGSVWALVSPKNTLEQEESSQISEEELPKESITSTEDSSHEDSDKEDVKVQSDSASSRTSTTTPIETSPSSTSSRSSSSQPSTSQQTAPSQSPAQPQPQVVSCDEDMKASYTSLRNSQISAEEAAWTRQVNAWGDYAASRGMAHSGYVQSMINDNKPAHDARLAQIQTTYQRNLASINCS